jgi:dolichol-phosphate mannosyltransferase
MRRKVLDQLDLTEPGFAVNAKTGFQPLLLGCNVKEVPISWINRTPNMGTSSFRLARVSGGYWRVLYRLWLKSALGIGRYATLAIAPQHRRHTSRDQDPEMLKSDGAVLKF